jgi:hypothetical protein
MNLGAPAWRQINSGRPGLAARGQAGRGWLTMLVRGTELPRPRRPPAGISSSVGQFMVSFGEPGMPLYSLLLAPLVAVMVHGVLIGNRHPLVPLRGPGISPRRLAMILSTIRFGRIDVIRCRIASGAIW